MGFGSISLSLSFSAFGVKCKKYPKNGVCYEYKLTLGDVIGSKKSSKNHRYRRNNRLRKKQFIHVHRIDTCIDLFFKLSNQNYFRSIHIKIFRNKFIIKNKLLISFRRCKSMRYPESPKVSTNPHNIAVSHEVITP